MLELTLQIYFFGWLIHFTLFSFVITIEYIGNPYPKSYKWYYKTYRIGSEILLSAFICLFWFTFVFIDLFIKKD
jgi:hypothetical protein